MQGLPGVGKTTFAKALSTRLRIPLVRHDLIKLGIYGVLSKENLGKSTYKAAFNLVDDHITRGLDVILDCVGFYKKTLEDAKKITRGKGYLLVITCQLHNRQLWADRLTRRKAHPFQTKSPKGVKHLRLEPFHWKNELVLDMSKELEKNVRTAIADIKEIKGSQT